MSVFGKFLPRYLLPFVSGNCVAAAAIVDNVPMAIALLSAAALLGFFSMPVGGWMIRRIFKHRQRPV